MEKTLQWLVPIATNTTKSEMNRKPAGQTNLLRIETLHHADKEKTEVYILDLVVWLHHLVTQVRAGNGGIRSPVKSPIRSPNQKTDPFLIRRLSSVPFIDFDINRIKALDVIDRVDTL
ncbi:hypothetical protein Golax_009987, partial [Gossypium laxum]|nr:hypothetical protein [Gossypium laxum]